MVPFVGVQGNLRLTMSGVFLSKTPHPLVLSLSPSVATAEDGSKYERMSTIEQILNMFSGY
jgi:hypothetical protein